jgi:hypothetical protein
MSSLVDKSPLPLRISDAVHRAIEIIVQRAKIDRNGVYWQLGTGYRAAESHALATSLGYGTPGILLTLLEYHRRTGDHDTAEVLHKGLAWVQQRTRGGRFVHGFYGGTPGLWYLYKQFARVFPGCTGDWRAVAIEAVRQASREITAGVGQGSAGTIIGVLACLDLSGAELAELIRPLVDRTLAFAGLAEAGLFWDCNITSVQPPLGFLFGNAGVEYALAHAGAALQERYNPVLLGSLARAQSAFDAQKGNWPDFDAMSDFRNADQAAVDRVLEQGETAGDAPAFSLSWESGAAGVLLGRSALAHAFRGRVGHIAAEDKLRALGCIESAQPADLNAMDPSIQSGLAGVALALRAAAARDSAIGERSMRCAAFCEELLGHREPIVQNDDLSLLSGVAGQAYALLSSDSAAGTCIDPLGSKGLASVPDLAPDTDPRAVLSLRMPACAKLEALGTGLRDRAITLGVVREQVSAAARGGPADIVDRCRRYELDLQRALAATNFRRRFWAEIAAQRRFARSYGDGMDANMLFGRFRLDESVTLLDLDFDPATGSPTPTEQPLHLLRQPSSKGVVEARLSPLQAALLREFGSGAVTLKAIHAVIDRVQTPNVTQRQLATLALKMVRGFICGGQIVPVKTRSFDAWLTRRKFRDVRKNLFPIAVA